MSIIYDFDQLFYVVNIFCSIMTHKNYNMTNILISYF
jgi:hypothetical protein